MINIVLGLVSYFFITVPLMAWINIRINHWYDKVKDDVGRSLQYYLVHLTPNPKP